ncbi:hypothetical protein QOZ80_6AG0509980 [Eleusine coracana subsp. coracana]|nr:hypothetical protein QOZ80_6AG0509980 [Eleusine coracana subsp. coracana]
MPATNRPRFRSSCAATRTVAANGGGDCDMTSKRKRLVGWPPVKCCGHQRRGTAGGAGYVKVKMEGVAIGRKVDVSLHASYDDLRRTLDRMFPPSAAADDVAGRNGDRQRRQPYVVTYEDGEGDWLLVGDDVPWEAFAKSVKRLKILA